MLPNFLIIGAGRCGTTSLYRYLEQHPDVYVSPIKEARYFSYEGDETSSFHVRDQTAYEALFSGVTTETAVGEASPDYLYNSNSPQRICDAIPNARLISVFRDLADRAYSHYLILVRDGVVRGLSFEEILESGGPDHEGEPLRECILRSGRYYTHLSRYLELFPRDHIGIFFYEDLMSDGEGLMRRVYEFVGVDPTFSAAASFRHNSSAVPRIPALHWSIERLVKAENSAKVIAKHVLPASTRRKLYENFRKMSMRPPDRLAKSTRERLISIYADEIAGLEKLTGRDLSAWRTV